MTIVVVQPDMLVRIVISSYLRECGHTVIETSTAEDVFTVLRTDIKVDVVFSEARLLRATGGFSLAGEIPKTRPAIDLILTSGLEDAAEKASKLCGKGIVKTPYDPEEIMQRIRVLRDRQRPSIAP